MKCLRFLRRTVRLMKSSVGCSQSPDGEHLMLGRPFMNKKPLDDYPSIIIDYIDVDFSILRCAHCGHSEKVKE